VAASFQLAVSPLLRGGEFSTCRVPRSDSDKLKTCGHEIETLGHIYRAASLPVVASFKLAVAPGRIPTS